ncbi:hypothetical protein [Candidatus Neptunichlamydia sp. REUL1]|uniref:hypothetical protein n=1 Tax=Candidatus Neptunichlamydia sp. REUL1 TaxID=3064277 RepID=UPI00292E5DBD|nr:hypothetical protein [Candidatus Neptunochlamydia sp. REUL1]
MKVDITELLIFFDELRDCSNEEEGFYWFKSNYKNKFFLTLMLSIYEEKAAITVYMDGEAVTTSLHFKSCFSVNILDQEKKCLEILHKNGRCFLSLNEGLNVEYEELNESDLDL